MAILLKEKEQIEKAAAKARQVKPHVKVIGYAHFEVEGSKGEKYTVLYSATGEGRSILAECSCKAGKSNKFCCYHIAATYGILKLQIKERAAARSTCSECSDQAIEDTGLCEFHLELREISKAALAKGEESTLVECSRCGDEYPEADMWGAGYAPVCPNCVLFG